MCPVEKIKMKKNTISPAIGVYDYNDYAADFLNLPFLTNHEAIPLADAVYTIYDYGIPA